MLSYSGMEAHGHTVCCNWRHQRYTISPLAATIGSALSNIPDATLTDTRTRRPTIYCNHVESRRREFKEVSRFSCRASDGTGLTKHRLYCGYFPCAGKSVGFATKAEMDQHEADEHPEPLKFDCMVTGCPRRGGLNGFMTQIAVNEHLAKEHPDVVGKV